MPVRTKICGIKSPDALEAAAQADAAFVGFVMHPASPRHVTLTEAASLVAATPHTIKTVVVCVDPSDTMLADIQTIVAPDYVQLHGMETPERMHDLRRMFSFSLIKALSVASADDVRNAQRYTACADMLLLDAKTHDPAIPGGAGEPFDWSLLAGAELPLPWFLSGGLTEANISEAVRISGASLVDVSSGVEKARGIKDPVKIRSFLMAAHRLEVL